MTEGTEDAGSSGDPHLRRLLNASAAEETGVLRELLNCGVDQGWFLRPEADDLISIGHPELEAFCEAVAQREGNEVEGDDPSSDQDVPVREIPGDEPGWFVLSQRCDLVRPYRHEPLVELARGRLVTDAAEARTARLNSPRLVSVADGPDKAVWAADLRQRALIPKDRLIDYEPYQPIPDDRQRKRFRLRLGQRYWRDPVPAELVESLHKPLIDALSKSRARAARAESFAALMGEQLEDGAVLVVAILASEDRRQEAEEDWEEVMAVLHSSNPEAAERDHLR